MPNEWNDVIASMRAFEGQRLLPGGESYRQPLDDEISEPDEFENLHHPDPEWIKRAWKNTPLRLPVIEDEDTRNIRKLVERFTKPKTKQQHDQAGVLFTQAMNVDKGKGKACETDLTKEDYPRLRQQWYDKYQDMLEGTKNVLPPWREVNHEIHLIDESKRYNYHLPRCPNTLCEEFHKKINCYVSAGWWEPQAVNQAAPLLCIPKKDGKLCTALDAHQCNDNTIKDVTLLLDQDLICEDVACAKIRSKINLTDAYEQVHV